MKSKVLLIFSLLIIQQLFQVKTAKGQEIDEVFTIVEEMPIFRPEINKTQQESQNDLRIFIQNNTHLPDSAKLNNITGRVFVSFVVNKEGEIENVKVLKGVHQILDREAVRIIKSLPKFSPGKQRGVPVKVSFCSYVVFKSDEKNDIPVK
jgi:periplasmic protein TonB